MLAEWNAKGIRLGYPIPGSPDDDLASEAAAVPDSAYEAVILNLAIRLAPQYGKTVALETKATAKEFKIYFEKVPGKTEGSYNVDHTAGSYVFDAQGMLLLAPVRGKGR